MIKWYYYRLIAMSIPEILYRARKIIERILFNILPDSENLRLNDFSSKPSFFDLSGLNDSIIIPCSVKIFGIDFYFDNVSEIDWHKDLSSGERYPLIPSVKINILKNPNLSAKYVWELNRLQFLTGVCLNYRKTGDEKYLQLFIDINHSWRLQNPYLYGINWYSNIEVNLRLITWFICWELLEADKLSKSNTKFSNFVNNEWSLMLYQHCHYSYNHPSQYSSANNHLISEYAGLFVASSKWNFDKSYKWCNYSKIGLEREILKQHTSGGINREEAAEYIQFITDFFLLAYVVGERSGNPFSARYDDMLLKIFRYIYDILDIKGNYPKYGDEDDGKCFTLDYIQGFNNFSSLMTSAAIITRDPDFKSKSHGLDNKNMVLFGEHGALLFNDIPESTCEENSRFYKEEGHFILRKKSAGREIYVHYDAAPLGFLSIAAHGHADALSFILHIDGSPFFIDSGTYTYHTERGWRNYFIGTLAHNTVRVNRKNQALNAGPTLWLNHYKTTIICAESDLVHDKIIASHDGFLKEKVEHIRELMFDKEKDEILISDTVKLKKPGNTFIEIPFHLAPGINISYEDNHLNLWCPGVYRRVKFYPDKNIKYEILKGQQEPFIIGWYSESFMKKEPVNTIYFSTTIKSTATFNFLIKIN